MQIKLDKIAHTFHPKTPWEFTALKEASCKINEGEYVGIIGSTGSGKTTLIEHLNGLLEPTSGEINWNFVAKVFNKKTQQSSEEEFNYSTKNKKKIDVKKLRQKIGIVFQFAEYQLFKNTIKEDIAFGPIAYGVSKEEAYKKAQECLKLVGLPEEYLEKSPFELSGGQKRRVAIAGILAMEPDFMVFDEPTAGLDPVGVVEILDILSSLNKQGKTIINVTHDLDNILERSSRVLLLKDGKIVLDGEPYEILNNIELLKENNLQPPQLLDFVYKLRNKGIPVPVVKTIDDLANFLNTYRGNK
ncbi:energy-coupling factor transporter ATPase [Mycoplasma leonicaptivi]|uniref:energy-coupling factor transporter ATPase n=1 Tax=Mycoplasma leonicaptivi TaxID=36742 RepID=UPI000489411D|nr:energy-coupling factor transporter ATPase [Mycoplasma leonicaptivi]